MSSILPQWLGRFGQRVGASLHPAHLFSSEDQRTINHLIDHVVEHVNPKLRALLGYRHKLQAPTAHTMEFCRAQAEQLPEPVRLDRQSWSDTPRINALFGSIERMQQAISSPAVQHYVNEETPLETGDCYGLLLATPRLRDQFGTQLIGDSVRRDVRQTTLNFSDQRVVCPGSTLEETRRKIAMGVFDTLLSVVTRNVASQEEQIAECETRLRVVRLKRKVISQEMQSLHVAPADYDADLDEAIRLTQRIAVLEQDLAAARHGLETLDDYLSRLIEFLEHPEQHLSSAYEYYRVDRLNIVHDPKSEPADADASVELKFLRGSCSQQPGNILLLVRFPRAMVLGTNHAGSYAQSSTN